MSTKNISNTPSYSSNNGKSEDIRHEILTSELGNQMLDSVAPIYDRSKVALYLFQALGTEFQPIVDFSMYDIVAQMFPQTATWGLDYWEEQYGIITDKSKPIEQRRAYFMSLKFNRPPMTPKRIESIVTGLIGLSCEVHDNVDTNKFDVIIRGYIKDLTQVKNTLNTKTPAHLVYEIKMAELVELEASTSLAFTVSEQEKYNVEVI